jgi:hypothetical protein
MEMAPRCGIVLKGDIRPGHPNAMTTKVASVEQYSAQG